MTAVRRDRIKTVTCRGRHTIQNAPLDIKRDDVLWTFEQNQVRSRTEQYPSISEHSQWYSSSVLIRQTSVLTNHQPAKNAFFNLPPNQKRLKLFFLLIAAKKIATSLLDCYYRLHVRLLRPRKLLRLKFLTIIFYGQQNGL